MPDPHNMSQDWVLTDSAYRVSKIHEVDEFVLLTKAVALITAFEAATATGAAKRKSPTGG